LQFRNIHETEYGEAIWHFLLQRDHIIRMETATYLERAALEPLSPGLLAEFGEDVAEDRVKRQVKNADGTLNLDKLYEVARRWHI
jgi:hypothetical protein